MQVQIGESHMYALERKSDFDQLQLFSCDPVRKQAGKINMPSLSLSRFSLYYSVIELKCQPGSRESNGRGAD